MKFTALRVLPALTVLITLATLTAASPAAAQSREVSILNLLIATPDSSASPQGSDTHYLRAYLLSLGPVTSRYGWRESFHRVHRGVDIGMAVGDTVRAALSGTVARVSFEPHGYGHFVEIAHDGGLDTRYAHLLRPLVTPGQYVTAGTPIALSGNSGHTTGPHLHFESRLMDIPFNPLPD